MSENWKKKAEERRQKRIRAKGQPFNPLDEPTDEVPDTRPDEDPILVKGQHYSIISFLINSDEYKKNNGLVDPFKDIIFKVSGTFNNYEQAQAFGKKLAAAYNENHPDKLYHHLLFAPLRKWSLLPNCDMVVPDPDDPDKVKPLVDLKYEQEEIKNIMKAVRKEINEEKQEHADRIAQSKRLGEKGKATEAELEGEESVVKCNISNLLTE
jgi:hypothetical protein